MTSHLYNFYLLQNDVTKTIIPEENSIIRSISFFNVGDHENLIVSKGDEIIMYTSLDENGRSKTHRPISLGRVCVCVVDNKTIACVSIWPNAVGDHEIHLVQITENNWQVSGRESFESSNKIHTL